MQRTQKAVLENGVKFLVITQVLLSGRFGWTVKKMDIGKPENPRQLTGITRGMERQFYTESEIEI